MESYTKDASARTSGPLIPFKVGDRVRYVGSAVIQSHDGKPVRFYGHVGTVQRVVKTRRVCEVAVEEGPGGGPRASAFFRADWVNLVIIARAEGRA
jgi:hypothetical protein